MTVATITNVFLNAGLLLLILIVYDIEIRTRAREKLVTQMTVALSLALVCITIMLTAVTTRLELFIDPRLSALLLIGIVARNETALLCIAVVAGFVQYIPEFRSVTATVLVIVAGGSGMLWKRLYQKDLRDYSWLSFFIPLTIIQIALLPTLLAFPSGQRSSAFLDNYLVSFLLYGPLCASIGYLIVERLRDATTADMLVASEERLRQTTSITGTGIADFNLERGEVQGNSNLAKILGCAPDDFPLVSSNLPQLVHPEDRESVFENYKRLVEGSRPGAAQEFVSDIRLIDDQDNTHWVRMVSAVSEFSHDGKPTRLLAVVHDVTAQKESELALLVSTEKTRMLLEQSFETHEQLLQALDERDRTQAELEDREALLNEMSETALIGGWSYDVTNDTMKLTRLVYRLFDLVPAKSGRTSEITSQIRERSKLSGLRDKFEQAVASKSRFAVEVPHVDKQGQTRWMSVIGHPVFVDDVLTRMTGTVQDVTERKLAEDELKVAALIYEHSSEAMIIFDAATAITLDANRKFFELTGYSSEETVGKRAHFLSPELHEKQFFVDVAQQIKRTGIWRGEVWTKRKDGESFLADEVIFAVRREDGEVVRYVAQMSDITEKKKNAQRIWKQANFDELTGLPNRRMLQDRLRHEIEKCRRSAKHLAVLFIDLDRFKEINDSLGHLSGDTVLVEAARRMKICVREADEVARLGGDEFVILLTDLEATFKIEIVVQRLLAAMEMAFQIGNKQAFISASIGISVYPENASSAEDLLTTADRAMYESKKHGRNCYRYFEIEMQRAVTERLALINDLRSALGSDQIWVSYQPIVELKTNRVFKAEALVRWNHPVRGSVAPAEFIPAAEDSGLIHALAEDVFASVVKDLKYWREYFNPAFQISVNISPKQLQDKNYSLFETWQRTLSENQLAGNALLIEITEGLLLDASQKVNDELKLCERLGVQIALDDFGTGYSSLAYLKNFSIDYLKIDRQFINQLSARPEDCALCKTIVGMAHSLGIKVIAEGVETRQQRDILVNLGCDLAQGYYFSKPVYQQEFAEKFLEAVGV